MTLIRDINNILQFGRKTTSYKFATLLGIFDYIVEHPIDPPTNNFHFIPIIYLARQFISYYYPFSFYDYYQGRLAENKNLKILNFIEAFKSKKSDFPDKVAIKIQVLKEEGIFWINKAYEMPEALPESLMKLLWQVRKTILDQPLRFLHNIKGETIRFFSIINNEVPFNSEYEQHRQNATKQKRPENLTWIELLNYDSSNIVIEDLTFRELALFRFWVRDVILKSWFEFILKGRRDEKEISTNIPRLLGYIYSNGIERDPTLIENYRQLYTEINCLKCLFSGASFDNNNEFHLDHFLPWSYYPVNRFWNLYPCEPSLNSQKSNNLPEWTEDLQNSIAHHLNKCLLNKKQKLIQNDLKYFYSIALKNNQVNISKRENSKILKELLIFLKKEWNDLHQVIPGALYSFDQKD